MRSRDSLPAMFAGRGLVKGAEVGVQRGLFAEKLLAGNPGGYLYLVDPWRQIQGYADAANVSDDEQEIIMHEALARCQRVPGARFEVLRMLSLDAARTLAERGELLDYVYIDADHSYEAVKADLAAWAPLVRAGGLIAGHDWVPDGDYWYGSFGVQRAVKEYFPALHAIKITGENDGNAPSWFVEV